MSDTAPFEIELDQVGIKKVWLGPHGNVIDVTEITDGVQVNAAAGQPTTVIIRQKAGAAVIAGEGIIYVRQEKIEAETILEMIDPKAMEEAALAQGGYGEERTLTERILALIKEEIVAARS